MLHLRQSESESSFHSCVFNLRGDAHFYPKAAALAWLRFYPNLSSHAFYNFANNRETDTSALILIIELLKHPEQTCLRVFGDTDSLILYPNPRKPVLGFRPYS